MKTVTRHFALYCGLLVAIAASFSAAPIFAQTEAIPPSLIQTHAKANFGEFFDMLALPNDAIIPADIQKNADWLEVAFRKRGFVTRQLPNDGKPLVFAEYPRKVANAKTILFYMHFDGQPVIPSQWAQKSPWLAVVKQRNATTPERAPLPTFTTARATAQDRWEEIGTNKLLEEKIDPEWRIFARAASDDKGPIMMFLPAFPKV